MDIITYLDKNNIQWFYINLIIGDDHKKKLVPHYNDIKMPTMNDFYNHELVQLRKSSQFQTDFIAIDTRFIYQIDIDTKDDDDLPYIPEKYKEVCYSVPYFLSSTKKLPHIFIKPKQKIQKYNDLIDKDVEILTGKWSYAHVNSNVFNHDFDIPTIDVISLIHDYKKDNKFLKHSAHVNNKTTDHTSSYHYKNSNVNLQEVTEIMNKCISTRRAQEYNSWIEVGMCLFNIDHEFSFELWHQFSKKSDKYNEEECTKKWNSFKNTKFGLNIGSLYFFAKKDNPEQLKNIVAKRVTDDLKNCDGKHNSIAAITYKLLKEEFVCATSDGKLWYFFDGNLWKEDKDNLQLRIKLSNFIAKQFDTVLQLIRMEAPIEDLQSDASSNNTLNKKSKIINKIRENLKDHNFKKNVLLECVEFFFQPHFLDKLDSNPNLIGFNNGVFHIKQKTFIQGSPKDFVSLTTGFDYIQHKNNTLYQKVQQFFCTLHPVLEQRNYHLKTIARQLYGDNGMELFHIHCGHNGSAGGGKTKSWEINKLCLGDYVQKFDVAFLVNQKRKDATAPAPEFRKWKGRRIIYCTEPNPGETLNSGVMKDLTGGEQIVYRMLFSNQFDEYIPQFKVHIMTNDLPKIDGTDEGVKRRVRVLPYVSKFVPHDQDTNHSQFIFKADTEITYMFRDNDLLKMEYIRFILDHYDHQWKYELTKLIKESSEEYLCENDGVGRFVHEFIEKDNNSFITLKQIKERLKSCDYYDGKANVLKNRLERVMNTKCHDRKKVDNKEFRNVFKGFKFVQEYSLDEQHDLLL
jgi:phage/plasmid-associated DNA primase